MIPFIFDLIIMQIIKQEKQNPLSIFNIKYNSDDLWTFQYLYKSALLIHWLILYLKPCMFLLIDRLEALLPRTRIDIFGKNSWMDSTLPYYMLTVIPAIVFFVDRPNPYILIAIGYSVLALLDEIFSFDTRNPNKQERIELEKDDAYFRLPLYTTIVFSWAIFFKTLNMWSTMEITMETLPFVVGFAFIAGNYYTAQFVVAHELMHKPGKYYKFFGTLHTIKFFYMHFTYHHLHRHHVWVTTPLDPSTSKKGQNIYAFIIRCVINSWKGVYGDEKKMGKSFFMNYGVLSIVSTLVFAYGIHYFYGTQALVIHIFMVILSIIYLQAINYVEHYGLERKKLENGEYEKVSIYHSWNAPHRFTNYFFFKVQRHSDHHENSSKSYQTLASMEESPFLPHGYILMIVMTFFPKVWFKVIDPLVDQYRKLTPESKGKIDPEVMEQSITETRKFLVEISLTSFFLLALSLVGIL